MTTTTNDTPLKIKDAIQWQAEMAKEGVTISRGWIRLIQDNAIAASTPKAEVAKDVQERALILSNAINSNRVNVIGGYGGENQVDMIAAALMEASPPPRGDGLREACDTLGSWMSAALEDPLVCEKMKQDIIVWFEALEAASPATGWLPIEEMPSEGYFLFSDKRHIDCSHVYEKEIMDISWLPTHWQPLPEPPNNSCLICGKDHGGLQCPQLTPTAQELRVDTNCYGCDLEEK